MPGDRQPKAFLPHVINGGPGGGANWLLSMADATMDIGILNNDFATFDNGVADWRAQVPAAIYVAGDTNAMPQLAGMPISPPGTIYDRSSTTTAAFKAKRGDVMHARPDRTTTVRRAVAAVAAVGAVGAALASFLPWLGTDTEDGGTTSITGWGSISGTSSIAGTNLNDVMGSWTYRPGLIGLIFGIIGAIAAISLVASAGRNARVHRITAAVLTLSGLACLGWGTVRGIAPGDAGVFDAGETYAEIGPWVTAAGGAVMIAAAVVVFAGRIDPPVPTARRGIQPR